MWIDGITGVYNNAHAEHCTLVHMSLTCRSSQPAIMAQGNLYLKSESGYSLMCKLISEDSKELQTVFPNLWKLDCIGMVLPTSIADCEQRFLPYQE